MVEYTAYFRGTLCVTGDTIEEAWKDWEDWLAKSDIDIDDVDIY